MFCEVTGRERDCFGNAIRADAEYLVDDFTSPAEGRRVICQQQRAAPASKPARRRSLAHVCTLSKRSEGMHGGASEYLRFIREKVGKHPHTSATVCRESSPDKLLHFLNSFKSETPQHDEAHAECLPRDVAVGGVASRTHARRSAARQSLTQGIDGAQDVPNHLVPRDTTADIVGLGKPQPLPITFIDRT